MKLNKLLATNQISGRPGDEVHINEKIYQIIGYCDFGQSILVRPVGKWETFKVVLKRGESE